MIGLSPLPGFTESFGLFPDRVADKSPIKLGKHEISRPMPMDYQFTKYFETKVLAKRPYLTREMCIRVVSQAVRKEW